MINVCGNWYTRFLVLIIIPSIHALKFHTVPCTVIFCQLENKNILNIDSSSYWKTQYKQQRIEQLSWVKFVMWIISQ
jgi:hypothetical protein